MQAYRTLVAQRQISNPVTRVAEFLENVKHEITRCLPGEEMNDKEFEAIDGFIFEVHGTPRLGITAASMRRNFPTNGEDFVAQLESAELLIFNDGKQFKKRIRTNGGKEVNDCF